MKVAIIFFMLSVVFISTLATDGQNEAAEVQDQLAAGHRDRHRDHDHKDHHDHHHRDHDHDHRHHHKDHHHHDRHHDKHHHHHDKHHHHHSDRECSVETHYWLPGIHEKRSCRNTANGNTDDCQKCCTTAYLERHNHGNAEDVYGFVANDPKHKHHRQCVCCAPKQHHRQCNPKVKPLTWSEQVAYDHAYNNATNGTGHSTEFGKIDFLPTEGGFVATCECKKRSGDECWLEFANGVESFLTGNSIGWSSKADSNGRFDTVSSTLVTCEDGLNFVNGTSVTHFTCYSWKNKN